MNNGHGQFTTKDAREYIDGLRPEKAAPIICACGAEVETAPMKAGVCYDCYSNPVDEAQAIEREIAERIADTSARVKVVSNPATNGTVRKTLHTEDLGTRNIISGGEVLEIDEQVGHSDIIF